MAKQINPAVESQSAQIETVAVATPVEASPVKRYLDEVVVSMETMRRRALEIQEAAKRTDLAYFQRKEIAQELRDLELIVARVRISYKAAKLEAKIGA